MAQTQLHIRISPNEFEHFSGLTGGQVSSFKKNGYFYLDKYNPGSMFPHATHRYCNDKIMATLIRRAFDECRDSYLLITVQEDTPNGGKRDHSYEGAKAISWMTDEVKKEATLHTTMRSFQIKDITKFQILN